MNCPSRGAQRWGRESLTPLTLHPIRAALGGARSSVVEHLTFNQRVTGSIPVGLTKYFKGISRLLGMISFRDFDRANIRLTRCCTHIAEVTGARGPQSL